MTREATLAIVPGSPEAMITVDATGAIRSWNRAAESMFGYVAHDIVDRPVAILVPEERLRAGELARLRELVDAQGSVHDVATELQTKDGRIVPVSLTISELTDGAGQPIGTCCAMRPLGSAARVADRFHESEKLAALRAISAGLAHDLGNPLAGVVGVLQLVARRTREEETRERLTSTHVEVSRIARLLRELVDFTRHDGEAGIIDVNEVLRAAMTLARYAHQDARVTVAFEPDPRVGPLVGSRNHLLEAFLHLAMNAYEAIGAVEGRLRVASSLTDEEIVVRFEDTGEGISRAAMQHLYEPFFTTKGNTGLGLFVCRRIVTDELGGTLAAESEPGSGARFTVRLPVRSRMSACKPTPG